MRWGRESATRGNWSDTTPRVSSIIVTYNREAAVKECLEAIRSQTAPVREVVVVDNSPAAPVGNMVQREFPWVNYQFLGYNSGPAGGFSHGLRVALRYYNDFYWLFDDDCKPHFRCLEELLNCYNKSNIWSLVKPQVAGSPFGAGLWSGVLFPQRVVRLAGLPKEELFFGSEDIEYERRIMERMVIIVRCPSALVFHRESRRKTLKSLSESGCGEPPWRIYYTVRGASWMATHGSELSCWFRIPYWEAKSFFAYLVFGSHRLSQCSMVLRGLFDGVFGRLGRRVEV